METREEPLPCRVISWLDFLLDDTLLEKHLSLENPQPGAFELVIQFLANATEPPQQGPNGGPEPPGNSLPGTANFDGAPNEPGDAAPEEDPGNRKTQPLKQLALKAAAFLGWDMDLLEKKLPLTMQQTLFAELEKAAGCCELNEEQRLSNPDAAFACMMKSRWVVNTLVRSSVPVKSSKGVAVQLPGQVDPTVVTPEMADAIIKKCAEETEQAVAFLEKLLSRRTAGQLSVRIPTLQSFSVVKAELEEPKHEWEKGVMASADDVCCQVSYELGAFLFYKENYRRAAELFETALSLYPKVSKKTICHLDLERLKGFCVACRPAATKKSVSLLDKLKATLHGNCKATVAVLLEDNIKREIPLWERETAELYVLQHVAGTDVAAHVLLCNAVRRVISGELFVCGAQLNFASLNKGCIIFLNEALNAVFPTLSAKEMGFMKNFVGYMCNVSTDFAKALSCSGVLHKYFSSEEVTPPAEVPPKIPLESVSFADNAATKRGRMEQALVASHDPEEILSLVKVLQELSPSIRVASLNSHWQLTSSLREFHRGLPKQWQDRMFVLVAKALELRSLKLYAPALQLFHAVEAELSLPQWRRLAALLVAEMHYTEALQAADMLPLPANAQRRPADIIQLARTSLLAYYAGADKDYRPCQEMAELCCTLLLNLAEWDAFSEVGKPQQASVGVFELSKALAAVCKDVCTNKMTRSIAQQLWDPMLSMLVASGGQQNRRPAKGSPRDGGQRDPPSVPSLSRHTFHSFLQQMKDNLALTLLLSCLAKMYNILRDDSGSEVCPEYPQLWPTAIANPSNYSKSAVTDVFHATLQHCLTTNSSHAGWVKVLADFSYSQGHHSAALKHYLTVLLMTTDYFTQPAPASLVDDLMYKKMSLCCSKLQCHTQAALFCQLMEKPDYSAAFKALNERQCQDSCDSLYEHVFDVTLLEFLVHLHTRRGELESRQKALRCMGLLELNASNNEEIQREAANVRRGRFLRVMARQYL
ncbi:integrator complex subunit 8-like [Amblyomma americanum]